MFWVCCAPAPCSSSEEVSSEDEDEAEEAGLTCPGAMGAAAAAGFWWGDFGRLFLFRAVRRWPAVLFYI
jgi:hypothetical protein